MKELTREAILAAEDLSQVEVEVPEWGGSVWVRGLTAHERTKLERSGNEPEDEDRRLKLVTLCTCDREGKRLFNLEDIEALGEKNWEPVQRIFEKALELNGMGRQAVTKLKKS